MKTEHSICTAFTPSYPHKCDTVDMFIQPILQVMGLSDLEVTQLVNSTDCGQSQLRAAV